MERSLYRSLRDSYRTIHPDPVARPGFTWWVARPPIEDYNPSDRTDQSRIDFVWYGGRAIVKDSHLVGEPGARDVDIAVSPWPSDHRAVVSEFEVQTAPMPVLVATEQRLHQSDERIRAIYHAPDETALSLALLPGALPGSAVRTAALQAASGRIDIATDDLPPGAYRLALRDGAGRTISRSGLWLLAPDAAPTVGVGGRRFAHGDALPITWRNAPGNRLDWIAIFDADAAASSRRHVTYCYIGARISGSLQLGAATAEDAWPLPGRSVARLLLDDGYRVLAESRPFTIE